MQHATPAPVMRGAIPRLLQPLPDACIRQRKERRYPVGVREFVYDRDGRLCVCCGTDELLVSEPHHPGFLLVVRGPLTLHHVMAHRLGGCSHPHNLVTLCAACNRRLGVVESWLV